LKSVSKKLSVIHNRIQLDKSDSQCQQKLGKLNFYMNSSRVDYYQGETSKHFDSTAHMMKCFHCGGTDQFKDKITET